jgi:hypothetical protein
MNDDTTSPIRRAAVEAAAREACFGWTGEGCDMCVAAVHCTGWRSHFNTACMSTAAYLDGMGRTDEAAQIRRMADDRA